MFQSYLLVFLGGGLGAGLRFAIQQQFILRGGEVSAPLGTLFINVLGSLVIGLLAGWTASNGRPVCTSAMKELLMIGVLGGFTTFSAFSLQTLELFRAGQLVAAGLNIVLSVVLCLLAVWLGHWLSST
jgi:fluoride exporter